MSHISHFAAANANQGSSRGHRGLKGRRSHRSAIQVTHMMMIMMMMMMMMVVVVVVVVVVVIFKLLKLQSGFILICIVRIFSQGPCTNHQCPSNQDCFVVDNKPTCKCPVCGQPDKPVCGSDKKTYLSKCELRREACSTGQDLYILKEGACGMC